MRFTGDMADAFGDWLERERIHEALVTALPELADSLELDEERPLLRVPLTGGGTMLVAKTDEEPMAPWVVGISDQHSPTVHETASLGEIVRRVLEAFESRA